MNPAGLVSVGLIGAGRTGSFHAETLATHLPGTRLAAVQSVTTASPVRIDELKDE